MAYDKVIDSAALDEKLYGIAHAIRSKTGGTEVLTLSQMAEEIAQIETGGDMEDTLAARITGTLTEYTNNEIGSLSGSAFEACTSLVSVSLPKVTTTGSRCFYGCTALEHADLPCLTQLQQYIFSGCSKLKAIDLSGLEGVGGISQGAFTNCKSLESITAVVYNVAQNSVNGCTSLSYADLTITSASGKIYASAFNGDAVLRTVCLRNEFVTPLANISAFDNTPFASGKSGGILLIPSDYVAKYQEETNWSVLYGYGTNKFLALEGYTVDGSIAGEIDWDKISVVLEGMSV